MYQCIDDEGMTSAQVHRLTPGMWCSLANLDVITIVRYSLTFLRCFVVF